MRRILITGIGGDVACAIIRCLKDSGNDDKIYGIDIKQYTPYMNLITETFTAPKYTDGDYLPFVKGLIEKYEITHFLPTTEYEIMLFDKERDYFEKKGVKIIINNSQIIDVCMDKYKTAAFLKDAGVDTPKTFFAEEYKEGLKFPFILKAQSGCGSKGLKIIKSETDWTECGKSGMICQELIGSEDAEYTVGVFSDGKNVNSITLKRQLGYGGLSALVEVCDIPEITRIAEKSAKAFGLRGSFNIQLREQGGRYFVFEINPRLSSTTGFRHRFGFKDALWWLDMADGKEIPRYDNQSVGKVGIKVMDDIILG